MNKEIRDFFLAFVGRFLALAVLLLTVYVIQSGRLGINIQIAPIGLLIPMTGFVY